MPRKEKNTQKGVQNGKSSPSKSFKQPSSSSEEPSSNFFVQNDILLFVLCGGKLKFLQVYYICDPNLQMQYSFLGDYFC